MTNTEAWDRLAAAAEPAVRLDTVNYGPELPSERELRLLGDVKGKRVLDLGCGSGQASIALARQGAHAIALDASARQLERGRRLAEIEEVRVEWHRSDLADLAFLRADSVDLAFSAHALAEVEDLDRVFRQVHRVLRPGGAFVFSYEHPIALVHRSRRGRRGHAAARAPRGAPFLLRTRAAHGRSRRRDDHALHAHGRRRLRGGRPRGLPHRRAARARRRCAAPTPAPRSPRRSSGGRARAARSERAPATRSATATSRPRARAHSASRSRASSSLIGPCSSRSSSRKLSAWPTVALGPMPRNSIT